VADYPLVLVRGQAYAEIAWDEAFASLYQPTFSQILLLGRVRSAEAPPPGWFPVDSRFFEVLDGGDWEGPLGFWRNLPRLRRCLATEWHRIAVLHLKLFYLTSIAVWRFNRARPSSERRPVSTLLVGDAPEAMRLRADIVGWGPMRRLASSFVGALIRRIQRTVDLAGFVAMFLERRFGTPGRRTVLANESWMHRAQLLRHSRTAVRQPTTILFVGRLIPRKRPNALLKAVAQISQGDDVRCVLVGDGPEREALERQSRDLGIAERVRFTGWLGLLTPEMLAIYDSADIFCLPSYAEGVPLVLFEAMGRGVAVIATAVSGTPEVVLHEHTGLLIPRDDVEALVNAIKRYLREPALWRRCVEGGFDMAARNTFEEQRGILAQRVMELVS
jgi:glycosyltransferase involved in cell wall biosynthesis